VASNSSPHAFTDEKRWLIVPFFFLDKRGAMSVDQLR
jgi:hypothetical protein